MEKQEIIEEMSAINQMADEDLTKGIKAAMQICVSAMEGGEGNATGSQSEGAELSPIMMMIGYITIISSEDLRAKLAENPDDAFINYSISMASMLAKNLSKSCTCDDELLELINDICNTVRHGIIAKDAQIPIIPALIDKIATEVIGTDTAAIESFGGALVAPTSDKYRFALSSIINQGTTYFRRIMVDDGTKKKGWGGRFGHKKKYRFEVATNIDQALLVDCFSLVVQHHAIHGFISEDIPIRVGGIAIESHRRYRKELDPNNEQDKQLLALKSEAVSLRSLERAKSLYDIETELRDIYGFIDGDPTQYTLFNLVSYNVVTDVAIIRFPFFSALYRACLREHMKKMGAKKTPIRQKKASWDCHLIRPSIGAVKDNAAVQATILICTGLSRRGTTRQAYSKGDTSWLKLPKKIGGKEYNDPYVYNSSFRYLVEHCSEVKAQIEKQGAVQDKNKCIKRITEDIVTCLLEHTYIFDYYIMDIDCIRYRYDPTPSSPKGKYATVTTISKRGFTIVHFGVNKSYKSPLERPIPQSE